MQLNNVKHPTVVCCHLDNFTMRQNATIQTGYVHFNIKVMELYLNEKSLAHEDTILICLQIIWYVNVYSAHVLCQEVMNLSYNARLMALTCILKVALTLPSTSWLASQNS